MFFSILQLLNVAVGFVVDQAEELFTLCSDPERRARLAGALTAFADDANAPMRVVLSVREDYFARLETLPSLGRMYSVQVQVVGVIGREALAQTILEPLQLFGYEFEENSRLYLTRSRGDSDRSSLRRSHAVAVGLRLLTQALRTLPWPPNPARRERRLPAGTGHGSVQRCAGGRS